MKEAHLALRVKLALHEVRVARRAPLATHFNVRTGRAADLVGEHHPMPARAHEYAAPRVRRDGVALDVRSAALAYDNTIHVARDLVAQHAAARALAQDVHAGGVPAEDAVASHKRVAVDADAHADARVGGDLVI